MRIKKTMCTLVALSLSVALQGAAAHAEDSWVKWSEKIYQEVSQSNWAPQCVPYLVDLQAKIEQVDQHKPKRDVLKAIAQPVMKNLWKARLALHDQLIHADNRCATEIRNTSRMFRFLEDFLGEIRFNPPNLDPLKLKFQTQKTPIDEWTNGYYLQKNGSGHLEIMPGDLIMARGVSFLSGMISRLGDIESQFSHVIFVTENPKTHAIETIESYVGMGVDIYARQTALRNENARLMILRPKNRALAKIASLQMRDYVSKRTGKNKIHYDYAMDFRDHKTMSCAEVSQVAYMNASHGTFNFPERPSALDHGLDLLKHLGIKPGPSFTPGDLESDSRFEVVGEWRDLRITRDSRLKDALFTKIFTWMDHDGYKLQPSFKSNMAQGIVFDVNKTPLRPLLKLFGIPELSTEIPRNMVGTVALVSQLGTGMLEELKKRDLAHELRMGVPMTYLELYSELEKIRTADRKVFMNPKTKSKSILFQYLR